MPFTLTFKLRALIGTDNYGTIQMQQCTHVHEGNYVQLNTWHSTCSDCESLFLQSRHEDSRLKQAPRLLFSVTLHLGGTV